MDYILPRFAAKNKLAKDALEQIPCGLSDKAFYNAIIEVQASTPKLRQRYYDAALVEIAGLHLSSPYAPLQAYFKAVIIRVGGDSIHLEHDYAENSVTLGKKGDFYYLIHQLGDRVKTQVWSTTGGASSDFIRDTLEMALREIDIRGLEFVPEGSRDVLEDQFIQSEYNYHQLRKKSCF